MKKIRLEYFFIVFHVMSGKLDDLVMKEMEEGRKERRMKKIR